MKEIYIGCSHSMANINPLYHHFIVSLVAYLVMHSSISIYPNPERTFATMFLY